ncbi:MAG: transporter, family, sugar phosphate sensor protein UhpC [Phycisphaerales bacterium]|jgi:OPA family glycerol-3-phosphate transporter-like MFS transporter/OPA family sugar phosphate sensor protein UhpC-like MFS transporter|nr:transporter, family, sugar phosphate sensor protein UhpC [Phycisphaerales bacterium]
MRDHAHYRPRILLWTIVGYAIFYFVRKNLSVAMPVMEAQLHITKSQLGLFLTMHGLLYGVSKFANGVLGDRCNARWFMAVGLVGSAILNICFGMSSTVIWLGIFWMANGWVQGMGFPPCARLLTHWFSPKELATKMSLWNTSHSLGAGAVVILCGYLVDHYNNWRLCFFVPATIAIVVAVMLLIFLRDTPASVGLPEVEGTCDPGAPETADRTFLREKVFANRYIWILAGANFFVYTIRYSVLDWGPTLLKEAKGVTLAHAGWMVAAFEVAGVVGMLAAGWITDRLFGGRGARTCVICMICCAAAIILFWLVPSKQVLLSTATLMAAGFFIYGPQALVGIAVANLATKRAAATAVGLTGMFGYASGILSGWGLGALVERYNWNYGFAAMLVAAAIGTLLFILAWPAPRDGYGGNPGSC